MTAREVLVCLDQSTDPVENLLMEDDIFQRVEEGGLPEVVRLWVDAECLVRGKTRSSKYGWYDEGLASRMGIRVVERSTGGGVVYHDAGNLNWSIFLRTNGTYLSPKAAFDSASRYVVNALQSLGAPARFAPPNRIDVSDRKVCGMAARSTVRTLLVHGTMLLRSNLERLNALCLPPVGCPPVANLSGWVKDIDSKSVLNAMVRSMESSGFGVKMVDRLL